MKGRRHLITGFGMGLMTAIILVMLAMPFLQRNTSFLLGFTACLIPGLMLGTGILWLVPKRIQPPQGGDEIRGDAKTPSSHRFLTSKTIAFVLLTLGGCWASYGLYRLDQWYRTEDQHRQQAFRRQMELLGSIQQSHMVPAMEHVLKILRQEAERNPQRTLTDETIAQIAALSYSLKPYRYQDDDPGSIRILSPERGQLLLMLVGVDLDTGTMRSILQKTTFANSDLRGANMEDAFLDGVDLRQSDLRESRMQGARLQKADLSFSNLWAADFYRADMEGINLTRSDLRWANLNETHLADANLTEVNLVSARLRKANLERAILEWTDMTGALMEEADLTATNMYTTLLTRAQCAGTRFSGSNLTSSTMFETNLTGADVRQAKMDYAKLTGAELDKVNVGTADWLKMLSAWNVTGADWVQAHYIMEKSDSIFLIRNK